MWKNITMLSFLLRSPKISKNIFQCCINKAEIIDILFTVQQILDNYYVLQSQFPGAVIRASSLSEYFEGLLPIRSKLPVVAKELGDTWIQGISSAPGKMAAYRAVERVFAECVEKGIFLMIIRIVVVWFNLSLLMGILLFYFDFFSTQIHCGL